MGRGRPPAGNRVRIYPRRGGTFRVVLRGPAAGPSGYFEVAAKTLREARDKRQDILDGIAAAADATIAEAIDEYVADLELRGRRPTTVADARAKLRPLTDLVRFVDEVRPDIVRRRLESLPSVAGRRSTLFRLRHFLGWCVDRGYHTRNPCTDIEVEGRPNRGKAQLTIAEARQLDQVLRAESSEASVAVSLLLWCGLRAGELLERRVRDLDPDTCRLQIADSKTDAGVRTVQVPPLLVTRLVRLTRDLDLADWMWPAPRAAAGHRGQTWLRKNVTRFCQAARVTLVCPQGLRGTNASLSRQVGMTADAVAVALGHESPEITRAHYQAPGLEETLRRRRSFEVLEGGRTDEPADEENEG